jgi:4-hydroxythreonine-4-phosphate dehydrogenase
VTPRLAVAVGDPGGVGPEVSMLAAHALRERVHSVLYGDAAQLSGIAARHGFATLLRGGSEGPCEAGCITVVDTGSLPEAVWRAHAPSAASGAAQLRALHWAASSVRRGEAAALVTGPTSKEAVVASGTPFTGQTEYLAQLDARPDDAVTMLFLGPVLRVGLVTTHLAVSAVPEAITAARVERTIRHVTEAVERLHPSGPRRIAVVGLNPHAGEHGLFGREEIAVMGPVVDRLGPELAQRGVALTGPLPAEAVFRAAQRHDLEGVVAMYHDQATIAAKLLDWGASVNTTWGLSFLRTSVDHGVAYDAARAGTAESAGMLAAMEMALHLTGASAGV